MKPSPAEIVARAEDVSNLLDHIGWTDTIRPELEKIRDAYLRYLKGSVLGEPAVIKLSDGTVKTFTSEQLAARADGIDFVLKLIEKILARGHRAAEELKEKGLSFHV